MQNSESDQFLSDKKSRHHAELGCGGTNGPGQDRLTSAWFTNGVNSDSVSELIFRVLD